MAYAEKVPSPKGDYWRGRFKGPDGRLQTVKDEDGAIVRFGRKVDAEQAAEDCESDVRKGRWHDPASGSITFADWVNRWYADMEVAPSTAENRRRHLENHLLPFFGTKALREIDKALILKWKRTERAAGYKEGSIRTWSGTLHLVLEDAVGIHIGTNPAARKRGRGKRSGRDSRPDQDEKIITTPFGMLLIGERMSIMTGRDDEFVMTQTGFWYALRLGELIGLEKPFVRAADLRVRWQLYELSARDEEIREQAPGGLLRCPPKDDSVGTLDSPPFMRAMLRDFIRDAAPQPCPCHGHAYVFRGLGTPRRKRGNMTLRDLAALAGVSETAVATVLGGKGRVSAATREAVGKAVQAAGFIPAPPPEGPAAHWRRSSFEELFTAAASGRLPARDGLPRRPVPLRGQWPGERVRGRNAQGRAEWCWAPVAEGMTPHGWRHAVKTWMEEQRIPEVASEARLRHEIPGVSGVYRHVTDGMRRELAEAMTAAWEEALDMRLALSQSSPVAVLDGLLRDRLRARKPTLISRNSPEPPSGVLSFPGRTSSDLGRGGRI